MPALRRRQRPTRPVRQRKPFDLIERDIVDCGGGPACSVKGYEETLKNQANQAGAPVTSAAEIERLVNDYANELRRAQTADAMVQLTAIKNAERAGIVQPGYGVGISNAEIQMMRFELPAGLNWWEYFGVQHDHVVAESRNRLQQDYLNLRFGIDINHPLPLRVPAVRSKTS